MSGIAMAGNIHKITNKQNSSSSQIEDETQKNLYTFNNCGNPSTNETYSSFGSRYWKCIRENMKQSFMKPVSDKTSSQTFSPVIHQKQNITEKQCEWTMEHQFLFTD